MFIANLTYVKDASEADRFINEHNTFLDKFFAADKFICSGRKVPRTGGIILNGVAKYEIIEFAPTKFAPEFWRLFGE